MEIRNYDNDLEQAFAEFGSWFCQKNSSRLAKVVTLGSYSTFGCNFIHSEVVYHCNEERESDSQWGYLSMKKGKVAKGQHSNAPYITSKCHTVFEEG